MLETSRLILRQWSESDLDTWAEMNADPKVMEFFNNTLTREESISMCKRLKAFIDEKGYGLWALELKETSSFLGFLGISDQNFPFSREPVQEIGWRLKKSAWGNGYATEAGREVLDQFKERFEVIYSVTAKNNLRSRAVMERLGLKLRNEFEFDHPKVAKQTIKRHVVYST